jgi:hypothetical protein
MLLQKRETLRVETLKAMSKAETLKVVVKRVVKNKVVEHQLQTL